MMCFRCLAAVRLSRLPPVPGDSGGGSDVDFLVVFSVSRGGMLSDDAGAGSPLFFGDAVLLN